MRLFRNMEHKSKKIIVNVNIKLYPVTGRNQQMKVKAGIKNISLGSQEKPR